MKDQRLSIESIEKEENIPKKKVEEQKNRIRGERGQVIWREIWGSWGRGSLGQSEVSEVRECVAPGKMKQDSIN